MRIAEPPEAAQRCLPYRVATQAVLCEDRWERAYRALVADLRRAARNIDRAA